MRQIKEMLRKCRQSRKRHWDLMPVYRGRCTWRKKLAKRNTENLVSLRSALAAIFILESAVLFYRLPTEEKSKFRMINTRQEYKAEWVIPSQWEKGESGDIYGIRICPENWEIQFYHEEDICYPK